MGIFHHVFIRNPDRLRHVFVTKRTRGMSRAKAAVLVESPWADEVFVMGIGNFCLLWSF